MKSRRTLPFQLRQRESVQDGILRIANALHEHSQTQAKTVRSTDELSSIVHETRLSLKRARALVRLLRPTLGTRVADALNRRLRLAAQRLAGARDATVALTVLDQLRRKRPAADSEAVDQVRSRAAASAEAQTRDTPPIDQGLARARTALRSLVLALEKTPWKRRGWAALEAGLEAGYRRARKRFRKARQTSEDPAFHDWRTATKSLLYQLAFLRPMATRRLERLIQDLDALQKILGDANDLATLAQKLAGNPDLYGDEPAVERTGTLLKTRQQRLLKSAVKQGRQVYSERTPQFISRVRREWRAWRRG